MLILIYSKCVKERDIMERKYVFDDINVLISHVLSKSARKVTPLRLQKTLYFMFAYYGSTYGRFNVDNELYMEEGGGLVYPKFLFSNLFEAWQYGPVIRPVYFSFKNNPEEYVAKEWEPDEDNEIEKDVLSVLDLVIEEVDTQGDFSLVERSHEDSEWINAFERKNGEKMDPCKIVEDYVSKSVI